MHLTKKQKSTLILVAQHMLNDGKVLVKDKHDNTIKESSILGFFSDYTVTLSDTIHSDYSINDITIIPLKNTVSPQSS